MLMLMLMIVLAVVICAWLGEAAVGSLNWQATRCQRLMNKRIENHPQVTGMCVKRSHTALYRSERLDTWVGT